MRWFTLFFILMFTGCQPSYSEKETEITVKSCQVATQLAQRSLKMFRDGRDQYDVMVMLNNYNVGNNSEAYAGKVFTQITVNDLHRNVFKAFKDKAIMSRFTESCTKRLGFKIPNKRLQ